jgi:intein/homing endonuclease
LQIGSKEIFNDLVNLGLFPRKSKIIRLPIIPGDCFFHFLRGYFDGDGNVIAGYFAKPNRGSRSFTFRTRFTSGSELFFKDLKKYCMD